MIFQDPAASLNERATVDYIISKVFTTTIYLKMKKRERKVKNIIREGTFIEHLTRYPLLSFQDNANVFGIARALVMQPDCYCG